MRCEIPIVVINPSGVPVSGASVQVNLRGTATSAVLYANEVGPTLITNPVLTDTYGRVNAWIDRGAYDCVITAAGLTAYTEPYEATPAKDGAIDAAWLPDQVVNTAKLADASVSAVKIVDGAVTAAKIPDGSIAAVKLAGDALTSAQIAPNAVGASELADNSVDTAAIIDGAVTATKIPDGIITSAKITDGTLVDADINAGAAIALSKLASLLLRGPNATQYRFAMGNSSGVTVGPSPATYGPVSFGITFSSAPLVFITGNVLVPPAQIVTTTTTWSLTNQGNGTDARDLNWLAIGPA